MTVRIGERRRSYRLPAAYPTLLAEPGGRVLARGRTANISEHGLFVIVSSSTPPPEDHALIIEVSVPAPNDDVRTISYSCRIVRRQAVGHLVGLGVEFARETA
jgi:c-di-GMP-binding flagellar brake protein YcgR